MKATNQWLKSSGLKAEAEGLTIIAAQEQTLPTKAYHHHIHDTDLQCHICNKCQETVHDVVSAAQN